MRRYEPHTARAVRARRKRALHAHRLRALHPEWSQRQIAERIGVSGTAVMQYLRVPKPTWQGSQRAIKRTATTLDDYRQNHRRRTLARIAELHRLRRAHPKLSCVELARVTGYTPTYVYMALSYTVAEWHELAKTRKHLTRGPWGPRNKEHRQPTPNQLAGLYATIRLHRRMPELTVAELAQARGVARFTIDRHLQRQHEVELELDD